SQDLNVEVVASRLSAASWRMTVAAVDAGVCAQWDFVAIMVAPSRPMPLARSASVGPEIAPASVNNRATCRGAEAPGQAYYFVAPPRSLKDRRPSKSPGAVPSPAD